MPPTPMRQQNSKYSLDRGDRCAITTDGCRPSPDACDYDTPRIARSDYSDPTAAPARSHAA